MKNETSAAKVELYNIIGKINGRSCAVASGWLVARYIGGTRRANTLRDFGRDEAGARVYAELWNGPDRDAIVNP